MPEPKNIGLIGWLASGKTTVAKELVNRHGYTRLSFATPIKDLATSFINNLDEEMYFRYGMELRPEALNGKVYADVEYIESNKNVYRPFLQWVGTDLCRNHLYGPDIWLQVMEARLKEATGPVVVDDVRFLNEVEFLRRHNFEIVRVTRPEGDRIKDVYARGESLGSMAHASESELTIPIEDYGCHCLSLPGLIAASDFIADGGPSNRTPPGSGGYSPSLFGDGGYLGTTATATL